MIVGKHNEPVESMEAKNFSIIVAAAENGAIGNRGTMPWHLPVDLKYFKSVTVGHDVIMGRKTFESIGRPLPGRRNLVISRQAGLRIDGCEVFPSLDAALAVADDGALVIGGAQVYREAWGKASKIYLTRVHVTVADYDASIPAIDPREWNLVESFPVAADEKNCYDLTFEVYKRI